MPNSDLLPSYQLALAAVIINLTLWVEQQGSAEVTDNVRGDLVGIAPNEDFIKMTLAVIMTPYGFDSICKFALSQ